MKWNGPAHHMPQKKGIDLIATLIKSGISFIYVTNKCQGWRPPPGRLLFIIEKLHIGYID
jgi:hypothetical protein